MKILAIVHKDSGGALPKAALEAVAAAQSLGGELSVRILSGEALPCGIVDEARPYIRRIRLKQRDRLVFCTDGVYDLLGKDMEAELKKGSGQPLDRMAAALMAAAKGRGQRDDMTIMVVEVA